MAGQGKQVHAAKGAGEDGDCTSLPLPCPTPAAPLCGAHGCHPAAGRRGHPRVRSAAHSPAAVFFVCACILHLNSIVPSAAITKYTPSLCRREIDKQQPALVVVAAHNKARSSFTNGCQCAPCACLCWLVQKQPLELWYAPLLPIPAAAWHSGGPGQRGGAPEQQPEDPAGHCAHVASGCSGSALAHFHSIAHGLFYLLK